MQTIPAVQNGSAAPEWVVLLEVACPLADQERFKELAARPLDWAKLQALAEQHGMLLLLARRLAALGRSGVVPDIWERLRERRRAQGIFALRLTSALYRALDLLDAAGIEVLVTKGPVLAWRCYGDAAARQYSDIDFIVRTKDVQRTTEIMMGLGYEPRIPLQVIKAGKIPGEYVFRRGDSDVLVEFHTEDTFRYHPRRLPVEKIFGRKTYLTLDQHCVPALSIEDELVLVCVHAAKHLWQRLAWVADVAALVTRNTEWQWGNVFAAAGEVGAERMLRVGLWLAAEMLGLPLSPEVIAYVNSDINALRLAQQISADFPRNNRHGILRRALFRMTMRGAGFLPSAAYLMRLAFSPTEDDWSPNSESRRPSSLDALSRPIRLARKYRHEV